MQASLDYLLLGDLRLWLEEPESATRNRWLLALLDMLLLSRPRVSLGIESMRTRDSHGSGGKVRLPAGHQVPFENLQRLRDRIAHHAPCDVLIRDLLFELTEWTNEARLSLRRSGLSVVA